MTGLPEPLFDIKAPGEKELRQGKGTDRQPFFRKAESKGPSVFDGAGVDPEEGIDRAESYEACGQRKDSYPSPLRFGSDKNC